MKVQDFLIAASKERRDAQLAHSDQNRTGRKDPHAISPRQLIRIDFPCRLDSTTMYRSEPCCNVSIIDMRRQDSLAISPPLPFLIIITSSSVHLITNTNTNSPPGIKIPNKSPLFSSTATTIIRRPRIRNTPQPHPLESRTSTHTSAIVSPLPISASIPNRAWKIV